MIPTGLVIVGDSDRLGGRARRFGAHRFGETEMKDLDRAVGADLNIRRLEIAVDNAVCVRGFKGFRDLFRDKSVI